MTTKLTTHITVDRSANGIDGEATIRITGTVDAAGAHVESAEYVDEYMPAELRECLDALEADEDEMARAEESLRAAARTRCRHCGSAIPVASVRPACVGCLLEAAS